MKITLGILRISRALAFALVAAFYCSSTMKAAVFTSPAGLAANSPFNGSFNLGLDFTVNTSGYVTAIGVYNPNSSGGNPTALANPVSVAIYDGSGVIVAGTLTTFSGTDWTSVSGSYVLKSLQGGSNPEEGILLSTGVYSVVAGLYGTSTTPPTTAYYMSSQAGPSAIGFDSIGGALTLGDARYQSGATSLAYPGTVLSSWADPSFGAGTFEFVVPEPAHFGLAFVGLLAAVCAGRELASSRSKRQSKAQ